MLTENKTSKYFKYAIGEIILVVIGILIALQVNNWNLNRQAQKKEIGILNEIKEGLSADNLLLREKLAQYKEDSKLLLKLDSLVKIQSYPYSPELNKLFGKVYGIRYDRLNMAFYEDLKSSGLQIISDNKIRASIVKLFEDKYALLETYLENERSVNQVTRPYYLSNFTSIDFQDSATPIDFKKIWSDPYFKNILHYRIITLEYNQLKEYKNTIEQIDFIIKQIDNYILNKH